MPLPDAEGVAPSNPKELISAYLLSKGQQPTNALMSQALMANAQNPGLIPGMRNMEPITSEGDPGFVGPSTKPRGGGGGPRVIKESRTKDDTLPTVANSTQSSPSDLITSLLYGLPLVGAAAYGGKKLYDRYKGGGSGAPAEPSAPRASETAPPAERAPPSRSTIPEVVSGGGSPPGAPAAPPVEPNIPLRGGGAVTGGAGDPAMEIAMQKALSDRSTKLFGNLEAPRSLRANSPAPDIAMPEAPPIDPVAARKAELNARNAQVIEDRMWPKNAPPMVGPNPPGSAASVRDNLIDLLTRGTAAVTPPEVPMPRGSVPRAPRAPRL